MGKKKKEDMTKQDRKHKDKFIDDQTFGLKNKNKSKKVQKYIKQVTNATYGRNVEQDEAQKAAKKKEEKKKTKE